MSRSNVTPRWTFGYFKGTLTLDEEIENLGGYPVMIRPPPDLVKAVSEALAALLSDGEFTGRFFADGRIEIQFHATEID